ncbi:c-type cytochrome [Puniceicoccaceae bacterium K14]|nr:c-type cytochrome [Puniceicoccaceae bacterium K14]
MLPKIISKKTIKFLATLAVAVSATAVASAEDARGKQLYTNCLACHGPDGYGNQLLNAPAIAGLSEKYIVNQLQKFHDGIRGGDVRDAAGLQMRPMAMTVPTEEDKTAVAKYVASLPVKKQEKTLEGGDPEKGKILYTTCAACHGQSAEGNDLMNSPSLQGQHDWYLASQLKHFKEGIRGANPQDISGAQMRPMAMMLTDEQAIKDVIAYIESLSE